MFRPLRFLIGAVLPLACSVAALAQTVTVTAPNTVNPSGSPTTVGKTFIVNPVGTIATMGGTGGGGGSTLRQVEGTVASGAADTGNPVKIGGAYTTGGTLANASPGSRVDVQTDIGGNLRTLMLGRGSNIGSAEGGTSAIFPQNRATNALSDTPLAVAGYNWTGTATVASRGDANGTYMVGNVASGVADAGNPVKAGGRYNATAPTLADGQRGDLQLDTRANLEVSLFGANSTTGASVATVPGTTSNGSFAGLYTNSVARIVSGSSNYAWQGNSSGQGYVVSVSDGSSVSGVAPSASTAAEGARILKASAGNLFGLNVVSGATAGVVQVFNSATIPADGAVTPAKCYFLAANSSLDLNLRAAPLYLSAGVSVAFSSGTSCFTKAASATAFISGDTK